MTDFGLANCKVCGKEFYKNNSHHKTCSKKCTLINLKYLQKKYYSKNKPSIIKRVKSFNKNNELKVARYKKKYSKDNYAFNPDFRHSKLIINLTNKKYPFKEIDSCVFCKSRTDLHHHHTTKPYEVDKFVILCRECHVKIHNKELSLEGDINDSK